MKILTIISLLFVLFSSPAWAQATWSLDDPGADRLMGWDESAGSGGAMEWFTPNSTITISGTTIGVTTGIFELSDATILKEADIGVTVQEYNANLDAVSTPGVAGTFLKSTGTGVTWDVAGGAGGGTIGGTLGSVDNTIPRSDGTGGLTLQTSLMTLSDAGSPNIPAGQTFNIGGSAHTHNYQPADADLTTYAGITPSSNVQSLMSAADYSAIRTLLSLVPGVNVQAYSAVLADADLATYASITPSSNVQSLLGAEDYSAMRTQLSLVPGTNVQAYNANLANIAGITGVTGDMLYFDGTNWVDLPAGALGKVMKMGASVPFWGDDLNDGGAGVSTWDELGDSAADATIALAGYKTIFTSTLNTAGANLTYTNTTADLTADVSFIDLKLTDDGDANGFFMRGYDNAGNDLKWSIGPDGAFYGYSYETVQSATGGILDLLEGAANGTDYIRIKADDDVGTNRKLAISTSVANSEDLTIQLGANDNTITIGSTTGVTSIGLGTIGITTTGAFTGGVVLPDAGGAKITPSATNNKYSGITMDRTAGETLALGDAVYYKSDGKLWKADADAAATMPAIGIIVVGGNAEATVTVLTHGTVTDTDWNLGTVGGYLYASETAGAIEDTLSNISDQNDVVQILGIALSADTIFVNPSLVTVVLAAP